MYTMHHDISLKAIAPKVYAAISTSAGFNIWWTDDCAGILSVGEIFTFEFNPDIKWSAEVLEFAENKKVTYRMAGSDKDWEGTILSFEILNSTENSCLLRFEHSAWKAINDHYRRTNFCWAKYFISLQNHFATSDRTC